MIFIQMHFHCCGVDIIMERWLSWEIIFSYLRISFLDKDKLEMYICYFVSPNKLIPTRVAKVLAESIPGYRSGCTWGAWNSAIADWRSRGGPVQKKNDGAPWWRHQMETFSASLAFVWGIHRWIPRTKGQWRGAAERWCFLWCEPESTAEQAMETPVIWDAIALIVASL